ncbi:MAG: hypothetical protein IVW51_16110 [Thermaceae bacterium]|nr:hypothetical protein [Thermaceae bacterium]
MLGNLRQLPQRYDRVLSAEQAQRVEARISEIEAFVQTKESEALAWLEESRALLAKGTALNDLQSRLLQPYPYLPQAAQTDLEGLRSQLAELLKAEAQEESSLKRIESMSVGGSLADLKRRKAELEAQGGTQRIREAASKKRAQIESATNRLEVEAKEWAERFLELVTPRDLSDCRDRINKALGLYEGTELHDQLEALSNRCKAVGDLLSEVEKGSNPSSPEAANQHAARLKELERHPSLEEAQRQTVRAATEALNKYVADREAQARDWLRERGRELDAGQAAAVQQKLSKVPVFLSSEDATALDELKIRLEVTLERQGRDKFIQTQLRSLTPAGTVRELREQEVQVKAWLDEVSGQEVRDAAAQKLSSLEHSIQEVFRKLTDCRTQLEQATDLTKVRTLATELKNLEVRLADTRESAEANALRERSDQLEGYIDNLRTFRNVSLSSPGEADERLRELAGLNSDYHGLGPAHLALGKQAEVEINRAVESKRREAADWLEKRKKRVEIGDRLEDLEAELRYPPSFLTEQGRLELEVLRGELRAKLDHDTKSRIEQLFGRLNASERKACLARLSQLLQEEMA